MNKSIAMTLTILIGAITVVLAVGFRSGSVVTEATITGDAIYQGVAKCRTCHKKESQGGQYLIWQESAHSKAYENLAGDKAKEFGAARGIENPQEAPECLKCHVTAYGLDAALLGPKYKIEDGVGCESCHGAGSGYYKKKTMTALAKGEIEPETVGLVIPDEKTCLTCHNEESPTFDPDKPFNFEEKFEIIKHPIPEARKAKIKGKD